MRSSKWSLAVVALSVVWHANVHRALGGNLPSGFSDQYQPAVEKLQGTYTHATITGSVLREYPQTGKSYEQRYVLRINGPKMRLDVTSAGGTGMGKPAGTTEVFFATPQASFYGIGHPGAVGIDTSSQWSYEQTKAKIKAAFPIDQPYSLGANSTILELLRRPQVKVESLKKVKQKGEGLVKVSFDEPVQGKNGKPKESKSWVLLAPSQGWAVRGYSKTTGQGADEMTLRGTLSYTMRDGVPVIEKVENWQEKGAGRTCLLHEVISISRFKGDDPPVVTYTADGFD